jgi:hypothetical protein
MLFVSSIVFGSQLVASLFIVRGNECVFVFSSVAFVFQKMAVNLTEVNVILK